MVDNDDGNSYLKKIVHHEILRFFGFKDGLHHVIWEMVQFYLFFVSNWVVQTPSR